jgi:hypothetical protein
VLDSSKPVVAFTVTTAVSLVCDRTKRRGPCLSRRSFHQNGNVYQPAHPGKWNPIAPAYGRVWVDVPGNPERVRRTVPLGICATKTRARQRLHDYIQREGIMTDTYAMGLATDINWRQEWANRVGLGFALGLQRVTNSVHLQSSKVA